MMELNLLTQRLFAEGWTKEHHPDYVCDWTYHSEYDGGFVYTREKRNSMVFSTPCGLLVQGSCWSNGHMSYMGIDWKLENNNPTIRCPYRRLNCEQNHPLLRSVMVPFMEDAIIIFCACHEVPAPYDYEKSADKVFDDYERKKEALFQEFAKGKRVCKWQCSFDEHTETWEQGYEPFICVNRPVPCEYCSILDKELDKRKGNIFYDIKTTRKPEELSLFSQEFEVSIQKDKRLLQNNVSLDICNAILKVDPDVVQDQVESDLSTPLFLAERLGTYLKIEAVNIRVESRASRDLLQDIADAQAGYIVIHEADRLAEAKRQKSERREKAKQAHIQKMKKLLLEHSLEELKKNDYRNYYRVAKMIQKGVISEEEAAALDKRREEQRSIEQLTFF